MDAILTTPAHLNPARQREARLVAKVTASVVLALLALGLIGQLHGAVAALVMGALAVFNGYQLQTGWRMHAECVAAWRDTSINPYFPYGGAGGYSIIFAHGLAAVFCLVALLSLSFAADVPWQMPFGIGCFGLLGQSMFLMGGWRSHLDIIRP